MTEKTSNIPDDMFARIATQRLAQRMAHLQAPEPLPIPDRALPWHAKPRAGGFKAAPKMQTAAQLEKALIQARKSHARFLSECAPALDSGRSGVPVQQADWRVETAADCKDFAGHSLAGGGEWERVDLPHYGEPLGKASTLYRTTFRLTRKQLVQGSIWTCFDGVDYKAQVFVNGRFLGAHEGYFAAFEFDATAVARAGENVLLVRVENDFSMLGVDDGRGIRLDGDKVYAATGLGYDEQKLGWHHCPAGMGICQGVRIEARSRRFIRDVFVRPLPDEGRVELRVEVFNCDVERTPVDFQLSLYGRNFKQKVFAGKPYTPQTTQIRGHGDLDQHTDPCVAQPAGEGVNTYQTTIDLPDARIWDLDTPWLYELQVQLCEAGEVVDAARKSFGMRTFFQDEDSEPKGKFYLNGREIRLRGTNTMGAQQQCVIRGLPDQLVDDILLAKLAHMNFIRFTQCPVQAEIYDICDRLGLMAQTDLPLFGQMRRNQFLECIRQAQEMERLIRSHPCAVLISYMNEPYPNATGMPHRHLTRTEMNLFFHLATDMVRELNPDRVVKCCDGDYDPPAPFGMPDNHCYNGWYIGHGLDLGKLHRGYWMPVEPGWHYGCGEFGSEGLDFRNTMERYYPEAWLPEKGSDGKGWMPGVISGAQSERFHYLWYETPASLDAWVEESHVFQAWITRLQTEAFRRDRRMNTLAIHLFIDAWPAGWMKTIMDCQRQPKQAWFTYRDALTPTLLSLRSDRMTCSAGEEMCVEPWVCNDRDEQLKGCTLRYELKQGKRLLGSGSSKVEVPACDSCCPGKLQFKAPEVKGRGRFTLRASLHDARGRVLHHSRLELGVFEARAKVTPGSIRIVGGRGGVAARLAAELGLRRRFSGAYRTAETILMDDPAAYRADRKAIDHAVKAGANAVFLDLPAGDYCVAGDALRIVEGGMGKRHFVSRGTGHPLVDGLKRNDFRFWYDDRAGYVTPLLERVVEELPRGWNQILQSGNGDGWKIPWHAVPAAIEKSAGQGSYRVCQVHLAGRVSGNPVAARFARKLLAVS